MGKCDPRHCAKCAAEFVPSKLRSRAEAAAQKFCSVRCARLSIGNKKGMKNSGSFKNGGQAWNKGLKGFMAGRKVSEQTKRKISLAQMGNKAPNWKGGISPMHERERKRANYGEWRKAVFERDNHTCQMCSARSKAGNRVRLNADHIKPFSKYPELRLELSNGRTLCEPCHRKTPTYGANAFTGQKAELMRSGNEDG
jgi:HNH endonuclease/NUMOD3 motif